MRFSCGGSRDGATTHNPTELPRPPRGSLPRVQGGLPAPLQQAGGGPNRDDTAGATHVCTCSKPPLKHSVELRAGGQCMENPPRHAPSNDKIKPEGQESLPKEAAWVEA